MACNIYTEKIGSNTDREGYSIFFSKLAEKAILVRKKEVEKMESI